MLFTRPWASLCLLAGSLTGVNSLGLSEDPDIKAISVWMLLHVRSAC